ncbi:substrate-binding domain-containing protein [Undibacterium sp. Ji50W]|uniref:PstS family phosphate ABC transporter substrate-binding protein n=1 Tax=Undibacterium sp. Ji50W TaxID=3413041 RepID=UPI003BF26959
MNLSSISVCSLLCAWLTTANIAFATTSQSLPIYKMETNLTGTIDSIGDNKMQALMNAWFSGLQSHQPGLRKGSRWEHKSDATSIGALMFENADLAPLSREPLPSEIAPYAHQFAGDMMKSPLLIRVAGTSDKPAYIAINKRAGAPVAPKIQEFLNFALSDEGQNIVAQQAQFETLSTEDINRERAKLRAFLPPLDSALPTYRPDANVHGFIRSIGSDGMKSLMDRWMREFRLLQPGVRKGERWEHLGTLNGFHALIAGEADIAPMGRELWPAEKAAYAHVQHQSEPLEIRVARGGFNTPQRTTAQAIFVHPSNPLAHITTAQLKAILGDTPTITHWGQLGVGGEWEKRPITIYMPPQIAPNTMSMQIALLHGGAWNKAAQTGSIVDTANALAREAGAIGFGGLEEGGPGLKSLAVAINNDGPFYEIDAENVSNGNYPLSRYMYIRLNHNKGESITPPIREFLRFILSRQGQEAVQYSGYFPLTLEEVKKEMEKLK